MSPKEAEVLSAHATRIADRLAQKLFALSGRPAAIDLDEPLLAAMLAAAFELGAEWQAAQRRDPAS